MGGVVAVSFSKHWTDEIAEVSGREEFQTCTVEILDPREVWYPGPDYPADPDDLSQNPEDAYDWRTDTYADPVIYGVVYSGQARFIPVRGGIFHGGEAQGNASTIRSMRFQLPQFEGPEYIRKGLTVRFVSAPRNPSLEGRWATVDDDFQGGSAASRTFNASMDIDAGGPSNG